MLINYKRCANICSGYFDVKIKYLYTFYQKLVYVCSMYLYQLLHLLLDELFVCCKF